MAIGFNEDLTTEILLRLPVKSILRFKTVSKQWLSIASTPRFRQIHASRIGTAKGLFFCPTLRPKLEFLPLQSRRLIPTTFPFLNYPFCLKSSSGGLLLLLTISWQSIRLQLRSIQDYFVSNPTTNEFEQLPAVPNLINDSKLVCETLAFDPCKSPHYKIAFLCKYHELYSEEFKIVIYSSENQTFSSPQATTLVKVRYSGVYCNDAIHWISYRNHNYSLYYYDLKRECMKESPLPLGFPLYIGESRGHLHLAIKNEPPEISLFEVHELKSDYSGWFLKYQVKVAHLENVYSKSKIYSATGNIELTVLSIIVDAEEEEEEEENLKIWFLFYGRLVACDCKDNLYIWAKYDPQFMLLSYGYDPYNMFGWGCFVVHPYIETLACVDLGSNKKRRRFG